MVLGQKSPKNLDDDFSFEYLNGKLDPRSSKGQKPEVRGQTQKLCTSTVTKSFEISGNLDDRTNILNRIDEDIVGVKNIDENCKVFESNIAI